MAKKKTETQTNETEGTEMNPETAMNPEATPMDATAMNPEAAPVDMTVLSPEPASAPIAEIQAQGFVC